MPKQETKEKCFLDAYRSMKLGEDYDRLQTTALAAPAEMDALIKINSHKPDVAADLRARALKGEPVSAVAWRDTKMARSKPTGEQLKEIWRVHSHKLKAAWLRASVEAQNELIKYMEENRHG